ncbi:hypothetical protein DPMN_009435 [Dreissena polymorpha]|uniref:Uncharacterized protein n=1 Tax=Dreissena polymorpha TaxID=45954 RepID=A0A9D4MZL1_DREPO|nr:hypothetical protein DPMN_009435 [Dreissena polymorpha]
MSTDQQWRDEVVFMQGCILTHRTVTAKYIKGSENPFIIHHIIASATLVEALISDDHSTRQHAYEYILSVLRQGKTSAGTPSDGGGGGGGGGKAVGDDDCDYDKDCIADTNNSDDDNDDHDSGEDDSDGKDGEDGDNDDGDCGNYDPVNDN